MKAVVQKRESGGTGPRFTRAELIELRRALDLIIMEDNDCKVNVDAASVAAKASALAKLNRATGWTDPFAGGTYVDVMKLRKTE